MDKKVPFSNLKLKKEFIKNYDCIVYLYKLKNGNLITCSQDKEINIYDKNTFELILSWTGHSNSINSICELTNNIDNFSKLVSCSDDKRIAIWKYNIKNQKYIQEIIFNAHKSFINKVIPLQDGNFASCSTDTAIFIWNSKPPYNKLSELLGYKSEVTSIIQMKNKKIVSTCGNKDNGKLKIWDLDENYIIKKVETISNCFCYSINSLIEIKNNRVAVGGYKCIRVINLNYLQIESEIICHGCLISSIAYLNEKYIISASEEGNIKIFSEVNYSIVKKIDNAHEMIIYSMCSLDDNTICTTAKDGTIKVWTY